MIMNKHILFYSDKCLHCNKLINLIHSTTTEENYKFISVDNPEIKIPDIIEKVPTLVVRGMNKPLIGKEVFSWIQAQQYINLKTNNINMIKNPEFHVDVSLVNSIDTNYVSLTDNDEGLNKRIVNFNKLNDMLITDNISQQIKDNKINQELQNKKLDQLVNNRSNQIDSILNFNKKF